LARGHDDFALRTRQLQQPSAGSFSQTPAAQNAKFVNCTAATTQKGLTVVPLEVYFKDGLAKVAIALAKRRRTTISVKLSSGASPNERWHAW